MKKTKAKSPVTLREKVLKNGTRSLYLDTYRDGRRTYEFLKLYLCNARTPQERDLNRQTMATAEAIRAKRVVELQNGAHGFKSRTKETALFLEYFKTICEEYEGKDTGTWRDWKSCLTHLNGYTDWHTTFKEIDSAWVDGFISYLDNMRTITGRTLSTNTKFIYISKLKACLNRAADAGIIESVPKSKSIRPEETERVYLTFEEVKRLAHAECKDPVLKRAFLFSCLTGLRRCDIERLTWGNIQTMDGYTRLVFRQKKTGGQEYTDITQQAVAYLGRRGRQETRVFEGFRYGNTLLKNLKRWCAVAGIDKHVTFHTARHSFAVVILEKDADIYTLSKLLGHKELATTQIYAKVLDRRKREAVDLIPDLNG